MFQRVFCCRNCNARFPHPDEVNFDGLDAAHDDVQNAIDVQFDSESYTPIVHECEQGGFGIADYVGVMLA